MPRHSPYRIELSDDERAVLESLAVLPGPDGGCGRAVREPHLERATGVIYWLEQRARSTGSPPAPRANTTRSVNQTQSRAGRRADLAAEAVVAGPGAWMRQAAVGVIVTVSFLASLGSGIVTSTTPSCVLALIVLVSAPAGSAIERLKDP